jgi:hypothetical protein
MTIKEIIAILQNKLVNLQNAKDCHIAGGNLEAVISIDNDILTTKTTIESLQSVQ